ncbi:MAG: hypothetical protein FRX49_02497 [Trebouxia sp. A1-2]|nr:MAG: hypothetical protein FRX49_02497 [Trebouxia sp. A1-2]
MQASASTVVNEQREAASPSCDRASVETLLWDLDGTLYPIENGYEDHGLRLGGYKFDTDEYWDFIRGGREMFLKPDPQAISDPFDLSFQGTYLSGQGPTFGFVREQVRECLKALPQRKWVFTNCNEKHARLALESLDLLDCFEGVLGADFMGENAKPDAAAFHRVQLHHIASLFVLVIFSQHA